MNQLKISDRLIVSKRKDSLNIKFTLIKEPPGRVHKHHATIKLDVPESLELIEWLFEAMGETKELLSEAV